MSEEEIKKVNKTDDKKQYNKEYYEKNKEYHKDYYQQHKEKLNAICTQRYRDKFPQKDFTHNKTNDMRAYQREYRRLYNAKLKVDAKLYRDSIKNDALIYRELVKNN